MRRIGGIVRLACRQPVAGEETPGGEVAGINRQAALAITEPRALGIVEIRGGLPPPDEFDIPGNMDEVGG